MHAWHDSTDVLNWCKGEETNECLTACSQELNSIANTATFMASCKYHACIICLPGPGRGPCPQPKTEMHLLPTLHLLLIFIHFAGRTHGKYYKLQGMSVPQA